MRTTVKRTIVWLAVVGLAVAWAVRPGEAHHAVLRFNLEEMTQTADRVFLGRCTAVDETTEFIAQGEMPVTHYTFEVERALKGDVPRSVTFTQLGHPAKRASKGTEITSHGQAVGPDTFFHGMSEYRVGDRAVLFLIPNYMGGKLTYPVGLYQGAFFVSRMPSGQDLARNSINNLGLFTAPYNGTAMKAADARVVFPDRDEPVEGGAAKALAAKRGALPLGELLDAITEINAAHGGQPGEVTER
jgi:hypothetical protein